MKQEEGQVHQPSKVRRCLLSIGGPVEDPEDTRFSLPVVFQINSEAAKKVWMVLLSILFFFSQLTFVCFFPLVGRSKILWRFSACLHLVFVSQVEWQTLWVASENMQRRRVILPVTVLFFQIGPSIGGKKQVFDLPWCCVCVPLAALSLSLTPYPCSLSSHVSQSHLGADGEGVPLQVHQHVGGNPEPLPLRQRDGRDRLWPAGKGAAVASHWGEVWQDHQGAKARPFLDVCFLFSQLVMVIFPERY